MSSPIHTKSLRHIYLTLQHWYCSRWWWLVKKNITMMMLRYRRSFVISLQRLDEKQVFVILYWSLYSFNKFFWKRCIFYLYSRSYQWRVIMFCHNRKLRSQLLWWKLYILEPGFITSWYEKWKCKYQFQALRVRNVSIFFNFEPLKYLHVIWH